MVQEPRRTGDPPSPGAGLGGTSGTSSGPWSALLRRVAGVGLAVVVPRLRRRPSNRMLASAAFRLARLAPIVRIGTLESGEEMLLDLSQYIQLHIFLYGTYEEPATRYLRRNVIAGWTFVDVGACEGYYAVLAAALGGPGSRVLAVEPNPCMADQLEVTVQRGNYPVEVLRAGCGSRDERLPLTISSTPGNLGMSSFATPERGSEVVEVPVVQLDEVCRARDLVPDVVKIDVEGFETEVLQGFARSLSERPPRFLLVECAPRSPTHAAACGLLVEHGYAPLRISEDGIGIPLGTLEELRGVELVAFERR